MSENAAPGKPARLAKALMGVLENEGFVKACADIRVLRDARKKLERAVAEDEIAGEMMAAGLGHMERHISDTLSRQIAVVAHNAMNQAEDKTGDFPEPDPNNVH